ncbi:hypothetical protein TUMEXPCC7403_07545 [Tumidithrix helvetica PCC 7403]|uniref:hypothetical protein n=1 Tax=Tumidithrix helvetica TaxID=3457545 RepID=UPI003C981D64
MTKKRLTDLLREEAQKSSENSENNIESDLELNAKSGGASDAKPVTQNAEASTKPMSAPANEAAKAPQTKANEVKVAEKANNSAELKQIAELQAQLEKAKTQEASLQQQVADLKQELAASQANAEKLQTAIAQATQAKTEADHALNEVKKDNLRLAEANIQLTAEVDLLKAGKQTSSARSHSHSTQAAYYSSVKPVPEKTATEKAASEKAATEKANLRTQDNDRDKIRLSKLLRRPVGSNDMSKVNQNIGWFD